MPLSRRKLVSDEELHQRRATIRRGLLRVNTAAIVLLAIIVALALAATFQAYRADQSAGAAREELWKSYLAQAQATRFAGKVGQRFKSMEVIGAATRIRPSHELRNEAIASLTLIDLEEEDWRGLPVDAYCVYDAALDCYALGTPRRVTIHRLADHKLLREFDTGAVLAGMRFSRDGKYLGIVSPGSDLQVRNTETGAEVFRTRIAVNGRADSAFDFAPGASGIAFGTTNGVRVADLATGQIAGSVRRTGAPQIVRYGRGGGGLITAMDNGVQIWEGDHASIKRELRPTAGIGALDQRADGKLLAVGLGNGEIVVWNLETGHSRSLLGHSAGITRVEFNPRGDRLMSTAFDGTSRFWDPESGRSLLTTHRGYGIGISPDDRRVVFERPKLGIGVWRMARADELRTFSSVQGKAGRMWSLSLADDGTVAATINGRGLQLWDVTTGIDVAFAAMNARSAIFLEDGRTLMTSGAGGLKLWPLEREPNGLVRLGAPAAIALTTNLYLEYASSTPDGTEIAADAGVYEALYLSRQPTLTHKWFRGLPNLAYVALSPDGQWLAAGTWHGQGIWVWNTRTEKLVAKLPGRSAGVLFSPAGEWLVTGTADEYRFWQTGTWTPRARMARDTTGELIGPMAFTRDGAVLALAPTQRAIRLVETRTQREIATLTAPDPQIVWGMSFNADASLLAVAAGESLQVWDLKLIAQELHKVGLQWESPPLAALASAPGSSRAGLAAPGSDGGLRASSGRLIRSNVFTTLSIAGAVLAILSGLFILQRHRRLIDGYEQIDDLVLLRNQELELAQTEIIHGQKMKALGTLAAGIAHDFNNLLSVIRMSNKLIARDTKENAEVQENVGAIEQAVGQGKHVVRSMLGYSRSESAAGAYSVAEVVEDTVALLTKQFLTGIVLMLEIEPHTPPVSGSPARLEQVLLNLIVNAAEAMRNQGKLHIAVQLRELPPDYQFVLRPHSAARYVEVLVADTGPGIDEKILSRIFEPFFTTKTGGTSRGTGLGLSTVYTIAAEDGMGIRVETAIGKGAAFRVLIPCHVPSGT